MRLHGAFFGLFLLTSFAGFATSSKCPSGPQGTGKVVCYYEGRKTIEEVDVCGCTHLVYTGDKKGKDLADMVKNFKDTRPKMKILLRISGKEKDLAEIMKASSIHGFDLHEAHADLNRTRITENAENIRNVIGSDAIFMLSLPAQSELLAKYYDLKILSKSINLFGVETHYLGEVQNETFHPSRLSGVWDMMNTDSVVDLTVGLGVPASKIIITSPSKAFRFTLKNTTLSTPGSPTLGAPETIDQVKLCEMMSSQKWTLERDQDLSAPYAFKDEKWVAFEDASSLDVKGKYSRIRGLAGLGLVSIDDDKETKCSASLLQIIVKALSTQARAPRGAVLSYLENEILSVPLNNRHVDSVQLSPYRISRVVDSDGVIHAIREDTRTEFECQRQGYFVHPRSCNRFYRCVKFDQLSDEFTVFEFDCPAGLAFDSRYEVCVWPGSLHEGQACPGSSEIAPVPASRFVCPEKPGYYADPANCRWFFACLDHGKSPLSAYEFRCPFGLGFDEGKLICDWPWLVPGCGNLGRYEASAHGHASTILTGSSAYLGSSADSINIAGHQSLISGASTGNLLGIQNGYGSKISNGEQVYAIDGNSENLAYNHANGAINQNQYTHTGSVGVISSGDYSSGSQILSNFDSRDNSVHSNVGASASILTIHGQNEGNIGGIGFDRSKSSFGDQGLNKQIYVSQKDIHNGVSYVNGRLSDSLVNGAISNGQVYVNHGISNNEGYTGNQYGGLFLNQRAELKQPLLVKNTHSNEESINTYNVGIKSSNSDIQSGAYYHDNSGEYKHDYSGEYSEKAIPYEHVDIEAEKYIHQLNPVPAYQHQNIGSKYVATNDKDSSYNYKTSENYNVGKYKQDNIFYKASVDSGADYKIENIGSFITYNQGENSGLYKSSQNGNNHKLNYNSGSISSSQGNNNAYVNQISSNNYKGSTYSEGSKIYTGFATTGAAHTLTAGAINSGLVGKTTLVDAELLHNNAYSAYDGTSGQIFGNVDGQQSNYLYTNNANAYEQPKSISSQSFNQKLYSPVKSELNINTVTNSVPLVTPTPYITYQQPIHISSPPQTLSTHRPPLQIIPEKSQLTEIFGYQKPAVTYVQPITTVSSTVEPYYEHEIKVNNPAISITNYNKPLLNVQNVNHNQNDNYQSYVSTPSPISVTQASLELNYSQNYVSSTPKVSFHTYQKPVITEYKNPLITYDNVTPIPTVNTESTYVKQPIVQNPTVSTFIQPAVSTHSSIQQNPTLHTNSYVHHVDQKYIQPIIPQVYVQKPKEDVFVTQLNNPAVSSQSFYQSSVKGQNYVENQYVQPQISTTAVPVIYNQPNSAQYKIPAETYNYKVPESDLKVNIQPVISSTLTPIQYTKHSTVQNYDNTNVISTTPSYISYQQSEYSTDVPQNSYSYVQSNVSPKVNYPQQTYTVSTPISGTNVQQSLVYNNAPSVYHSTPKPTSFLQYISPQKTQITFQNIQPQVSYSQTGYISTSQEPIKYQQQNIYTNKAYSQPAIAINVEQTDYQSQKVQPSYETSKIYSSKIVQQPVVNYYNTYDQQKKSEYSASNYDSNYKQSYISSTTESPISYTGQNVNIYNKNEGVNQYQSISYQTSTNDYAQSKYTDTYKPVTSASPTVSIYKGPGYLPPTNPTKIEVSSININNKYLSKTSDYITPASPSYQSSSFSYTNPIQEFSFNKVSTTPRPIVNIDNQSYLSKGNYNSIKKPIATYIQPQLSIDYTNNNEEKQSNLLGFSTVGPNAGLVSSTFSSITEDNDYFLTTSQPVKVPTSTYTPVKHKIVEVTPQTIRKTRPKVAVVTKVNDYNPIIVRKLGAMCSCRSNVLKLRKPQQQIDEGEYEVEYDYDVPTNGGSDEEWTYKSSNNDRFTPSSSLIKSVNPTSSNIAIKSTTPIVKKPKIIVSSTFSPIIVDDEYDDTKTESYLKSTFDPIIVAEDSYQTTPTALSEISSTRSQPVRVKTRTKFVTLAPTFEAIIIPKKQISVTTEKYQDDNEYNSYSSSGRRPNDESLRGVECKREGLFRHPKNCNKFYSCRWDCSKNKYTLHEFKCPIQLSFDPSMGACNWPSQGPACQGDTLLPSGF